MSWTEIMIAIKRGIVASAESVANIVSGATKVGNADKLDGLDASSFLLLSDYNTRIIGGTEVIDFNTLFETKNYAFSSNSISIAVNAPVVSSGFLKVTKGGGYTHQEYTSNSSIRYFRTYNGSTWGSWKNAADGGNADTVDGFHAADFLKLTGGIVDNLKIAREDNIGEGGQIVLEKPMQTAIEGDVAIDVNSNRFRIFESSSPYRGVYIDITKCAETDSTELLHTANSAKVIVSTTAPADTAAVWIVPN